MVTTDPMRDKDWPESKNTEDRRGQSAPGFSLDGTGLGNERLRATVKGKKTANYRKQPDDGLTPAEVTDKFGK